MKLKKRLKRLYSKITIDPETGCWNWSGAKGSLGYGQSWYEGRLIGAHRLMYMLLAGPIESGLVIDHLCRNPGCVNPEHLEPVTHAENIRRGYASKNGECCGKGHPWTDENTYRPRVGSRQCRECNRLRQQEWRDANPGRNAEFCRRYQERKCAA